MSTIRRSLSTRVDGDGKSEVYLRFSGGRGKVFRVKSGIRVPASRWNARTGDVVLPRIATPEQEELLEARRRLDELCNMLMAEYASADKDAVDSQWFTAAVHRFAHPDARVSGPGPDLQSLLVRYEGESGLSQRRLMNVRVLFRELVRFGMFRSNPVDVRTVSSEDLYAFEDFLRNEHVYFSQGRYRHIYEAVPETREPKPRGRNTISNSMKMLRTFLSWCRRHGLTDADPFAGYELKSEVYGTPYYISIEERERLACVDLSAFPALAVQRDIFVFQCLIGCRVGDLVNLKKSSVIDRAVEYIAGKTAGERPSVIRVPLNASAMEIVERYADMPGDSLLPFISPQKYNDAIKRMFTLAGLTRVVTVLDPLTGREMRKPLNEIASSHLARRTFVGNLYRQVRDPALVGALSGHKEGSRAFARYRTIDEGMKADLVRLLEPEGKRGKE